MLNENFIHVILAHLVYVFVGKFVMDFDLRLPFGHFLSSFKLVNGY